VCAALVVSSSRLEAAVVAEETSDQFCVFATSPAGTALRFLARGGIGEWSPSGASLTIGRVDPEQSEPTGSGTRVIRRTGELIRDFTMSFDKAWLDDKRLLMTDGRQLHAVARLDGSLRVVRPPIRSGFLIDATVASAAKLIVFAGYQNNGDQYRRFWFFNADGRLTTFRHPARISGGKHSVSPDGQWIAATSEYSVAGRSTWLQRRNGTSVGLAPIAASAFAWSRDSRRLAVIMRATGSDMEASPAAAGLYVHETGRRGSFRRVARGNVGDVSWSPTGKRIAYTAAGGLYTVSAAGGSPVRISRHEGIAPLGGIERFGSSFRAAWSPDGQQLAYALQGAIFKVKAADGRSTRITPADGYISPTWSPDGKLIAFERRRSMFAAASECPPD